MRRSIPTYSPPVAAGVLPADCSSEAGVATGTSTPVAVSGSFVSTQVLSGDSYPMTKQSKKSKHIPSSVFHSNTILIYFEHSSCLVNDKGLMGRSKLKTTCWVLNGNSLKGCKPTVHSSWIKRQGLNVVDVTFLRNSHDATNYFQREESILTLFKW